ncbi:MAG TPA: GGDEF domain-containing protein [Dokdonella sp.]|uniref:GGDEF domain-containing protein n=1 Tax=Dokdonella sp. TaxID=2291710 RepID=UPI002D805707|nr:GGDEF domain-containing protein [Dokdonella sp.]HET9033574.1 GGDEF domain-containing protein [Dokdonella sp.]
MNAALVDQAQQLRLERRLKTRIRDTYARSSSGAFLYLIGWLPLLMVAELPRRHPVLAAFFTLGMLAAAILRKRIRPPAPDAAIEASHRWINRYCAVVMSSVVLWTVAQIFVLRDPEVSLLVKSVSLFGTLAFSTQIAHLYTSMLRLAVTGILIMVVPTVIQLWSDSAMHVPAAAFSLYAIYLVTAVMRSRIEYTRRLDLDDAVRDQRDLYEQLSRTDPLTGLCNRRTFAETLNAQVREAQWLDGASVALALLDIDHFKLINDQHGHVIGDEVLKHLARRLERAFCGEDVLIARTGGEEFGLIFRDTDEVVATVRAEAFRESLDAQPIICAGLSLSIKVSIGVGSFNAERDSNDDDLYGAVDVALYAAKQQGRNRVVAVSMLTPDSTERRSERESGRSRRATDL